MPALSSNAREPLPLLKGGNGADVLQYALEQRARPRELPVGRACLTDGFRGVRKKSVDLARQHLVVIPANMRGREA